MAIEVIHRFFFSAFLLLVVGASTSAEQIDSKRMNLYADKPDPQMVPFLGNAWTIYLSGEIDADAGKRLRRYLTENNTPAQSFVYLNSPGGSVIGGMELGRVFREFALRTDVGVRDQSGKLNTGYCFSACALAFLGGEFRYLKAGSRYGVHRFVFQKEAASNVEIAQVISAAISEYIRSMNVDPALFSLSAVTASSDMYEPTRAQLTALGVLNNGFGITKWSLESFVAGVYLKGERHTTYGINKFIIMCVDHQPSLYIVIDPQGRGEMISKFRADSLYVDGQRFRIQKLLRKKSLHNGWVNAFYELPESYLAKIRTAQKSVGVIMQGGYESGVFFGFDSMPFEEGATKLPGFLRACG